jgi:ABC-type Zn2+ transport system substrate-binding protein/surface adhesin
LLLANQGLLVAHAHRGAGFAGPDGHASHTHVHTGGHTHGGPAQKSDHSHGDHAEHAPESGHAPEADETFVKFVRAVFPNSDHDSNAVYCGESGPFARKLESTSARFGKNVAPSGVVVVATRGVAHLGAVAPRFGPLSGRQPSAFSAACPIYLRMESLRI